jgi:hypothetical protein
MGFVCTLFANMSDEAVPTTSGATSIKRAVKWLPYIIKIASTAFERDAYYLAVYIKR